MLEHVKSKGKLLGPLMNVFNPLAVTLSGANINRDTVTNLEKAGLIIQEETDLIRDIVKDIVSVKK